MRTADGETWASGAPLPMSVEAGKPWRLVSVPLAEAPPGESEIVLTVRDEVSDRTFEAGEPFRVEPAEGAAGESREGRPGRLPRPPAPACGGPG